MLADPAKSCAVLVGTHHYTHLEDLPAVDNNTSRLGELLADAETWGLPADRFALLRQPANAAQVVDAVMDAADRAEDTLILYYAGHGLTVPRTFDLALALVESRPNAPHTALPFDWIRQAMLSGRATKKVVILDCCYSARALAGGMAGAVELANDAQIEGTYILTAAAETKKALAPPGEKYTAFTGELISVLENGIPGKPEFLDMGSIYATVHAALARKSRPLPQQRNRNSASRISFVRNKAHEVAGPSDSSDPFDVEDLSTVAQDSPRSISLLGGWRIVGPPPRRQARRLQSLEFPGGSAVFGSLLTQKEMVTAAGLAESLPGEAAAQHELIEFSVIEALASVAPRQAIIDAWGLLEYELNVASDRIAPDKPIGWPQSAQTLEAWDRWSLLYPVVLELRRLRDYTVRSSRQPSARDAARYVSVARDVVATFRNSFSPGPGSASGQDSDS
jgi:hypothetical protein